MSIDIHPIRLGFDGCYLLVAENGSAVLIDGGEPGRDAIFAAALSGLGIEPKRIGLLVVTHCHWDHIGCIESIRELTGCKVAVHAAEREWVEAGRKVNPPGVTTWGRVVATLVDCYLPLVRIPPSYVDVVIEDDGLSLEEYGMSGQVMHTPGHSPGSVSVVLPSGEAFVGDLAMNRLPLRRRPGLPIFAHNKELISDSWQKILAAGAERIYPAHGEPFPADVMRQAIAQ